LPLKIKILGQVKKTKDFMPTSIHKINTIFSSQPICPVPRGELWLGTELLSRAGFTDTPDNHLRMVEKLGQDMVCLPVADDTADKPDLGYLYFQCSALKTAVNKSDHFVAAVVDGPFQQLANHMGLMDFLIALARNRQDVFKAYAAEQAKVLELIYRCIDQGVDAVVIADDFASDAAPLISPSAIEKLCANFYTQAVATLHKAHARAFLHSCGSIIQLMTLINTWQIDGLASVQHRCNDLVALKKILGPSRVIMAGIEAELLASDSPRPGDIAEYKHIVKTLAPIGGLILSSSCGLYNGDFLERIQKIYAIADGLAKG
jgi:uroporphyrinogen-III decarboxylase